jgi:hypothetical protein
MTSGQNITQSNLTFRCAPIPNHYCYRNVSLANVSGYTDDYTNVSIDCKANVNITLTNGASFYDMIHNFNVYTQSCNQNVEWHLGIGGVQFNPVCNITAYGANSDSIKTNNTFNMKLGDNLTDSISGNKYNAPAESSCPWKKKNASQTLIAPANYSDSDTATYISCARPFFNESIVYNYTNASCNFRAPVCMDYFDALCTDDEKYALNLTGCVNRLASPEVWTAKLQETQNTSDYYQSEYQKSLEAQKQCEGTLTSGSAFMDKIWYLVIAVAIGFILGILALVGILMWRKQVAVGSRPTLPPTIGGNTVHIDRYGSLGTPPKASDTNQHLLPRGYKEG